MRSSRRLPFLGVPVALLGCAVGPDHEVPERRTDPEWQLELERGLKSEPADLAQWWQVFDDPTLTQLVEAAVRRNPDLALAASRVREARFRRAVATGELGPTVAANGLFERTDFSENEVFSFIGSQDLWSAGFDATWELDVFGGLRRGREAADAEVGVRVEDYRDLLISLIAEVARSYVDLCSFRELLRIAEDNLRIQRDTLELTQSRFEAGLTGELDVAQAASNVATTRALIPPAQQAIAETESRLAVLLGIDPGSLGAVAPELMEPHPVPVVPAEVAVGVPAELLRRRPDIRRAERQIARTSAEIGVATADLYPRFALTGSIGLSSQDAQDLFEGNSLRYAWGPSVSWNVFASGRILNNVRAAEEVHVQTLIQYEQSVLLALEEVRNTMVAHAREQDRREALLEGEAAARNAVELARTVYVQGVVDFQSVLDAERTLFSLQEQLANSERRVTTNMIALYKALGGGWERLAPTIEEEPGSEVVPPGEGVAGG